MPSPADEMLIALKGKNTDEIVRLVKDNPELVNMVLPEFDDSLMKMMLIGAKPLDFVQAIVGHPDFNFAFINSDKDSNLDVIISSGRVDILEANINNPKVLINKEQLSYETAKECLELANARLSREQKKSPNSKSTERARIKVDNLEKMIPMLAEATIKYAVAKDDPILCIRLEKAGVDLDKPLSSEKKPVQLLNRSNPKLLEWFMGERFANKAAKRAVVDPDCLNKQREAQSQLDAARQGFFAEGARILGKATAGRLERMKEADKISPPSRKL